jgi:hypothetical protein
MLWGKEALGPTNGGSGRKRNPVRVHLGGTSFRNRTLGHFEIYDGLEETLATAGPAFLDRPRTKLSELIDQLPEDSILDI